MAETKTRLDERTIGRIPVAHWYEDSSAGSDAYAITLDPPITAYEEGRFYAFKADVANTGAATLNINSIGAVTLKKQGDVDLTTGDILAGQIIYCAYDGTNMQLISPTSNTIPVAQSYGASSAGSDTYAITLSPAPTAYETGRMYLFKADVANTGAATLNVNSLGAVTLKKNVSSDLEDNDILANTIITAIYDGTNMQVVAGLSQPVQYPSIVFTIAGTDNIYFSDDREHIVRCESTNIHLLGNNMLKYKNGVAQTVSVTTVYAGSNFASAIIQGGYIYAKFHETDLANADRVYRCLLTSDISSAGNWQQITLSGVNLENSNNYLVGYGSGQFWFTRSGNFMPCTLSGTTLTKGTDISVASMTEQKSRATTEGLYARINAAPYYRFYSFAGVADTNRQGVSADYKMFCMGDATYVETVSTQYARVYI